MNPVVTHCSKAPGFQPLKLKCDFLFSQNLLLSNSTCAATARVAEDPSDLTARRRLVDAALKAGAADEAVAAAAEGPRLLCQQNKAASSQKKPQFRGGAGGAGARSRSGVGYGARDVTATDVADAHFTHGVALQARYAAAQAQRREDQQDLIEAVVAYRKCRAAAPRHGGALQVESS